LWNLERVRRHDPIPNLRWPSDGRRSGIASLGHERVLRFRSTRGRAAASRPDRTDGGLLMGATGGARNLISSCSGRLGESGSQHTDAIPGRATLPLVGRAPSPARDPDSMLCRRPRRWPTPAPVSWETALVVSAAALSWHDAPALPRPRDRASPPHPATPSAQP